MFVFNSLCFLSGNVVSVVIFPSVDNLHSHMFDDRISLTLDFTTIGFCISPFSGVQPFCGAIL